MIAHPLTHLPAQQRHVEQLSLVSQQILADAWDVINSCIGDQDNVISRLYGLQTAVQAHEFADFNFQEGILQDLDEVIDAVASVENCQEVIRQEEANIDPDFVAAVQEETEHIEVGVIRDGRNGRPPLDVSVELMQSLIEDDYNHKRIADLLQISSRTVYYICDEYNLSFNDTRKLSEAQIDEYVGSVSRDYPRFGRKIINSAYRKAI
eukprot:363981_1